LKRTGENLAGQRWRLFWLVNEEYFFSNNISYLIYEEWKEVNIMGEYLTRKDWGSNERIGGQIFILYFLKLLLRRLEENLVKNKDSTPGLS